MSKDLVGFGEDLDGSACRIGIVKTRWNPEIVDSLYEGVRAALKETGVKDANIYDTTVPGSFELPLAARFLAMSRQCDVVITIGCLIKGDTMHFEYIAEAVTKGLMDVRIEGKRGREGGRRVLSLNSNSCLFILQLLFLASTDPAANDHPRHFRPPDRAERGPGHCSFQGGEQPRRFLGQNRGGDGVAAHCRHGQGAEQGECLGWDWRSREWGRHGGLDENRYSSYFYFFVEQATLPLTEKREDTPDDKKQARQFGF